jgi:hypothetical protein
VCHLETAQCGWSISRLVLRQKAAILSDIIINEKLKTIENKLFGLKSGCNRTSGKTMYVVAYLFFGGPLLIGLVGLKALSPRIKVVRTWNITFSHLFCHMLLRHENFTSLL